MLRPSGDSWGPHSHPASAVKGVADGPANRKTPTEVQRRQRVRCGRTGGDPGGPALRRRHAACVRARAEARLRRGVWRSKPRRSEISLRSVSLDILLPSPIWRNECSDCFGVLQPVYECMTWPPSTLIVCPVTCEARAEERNTTMSATSSVDCQRASGTTARTLSPAHSS